MGGGNHLFKALLFTFDLFVGHNRSLVYLQGMEQQVLMMSILLKSVAVCVSIQPDLARAILVGDKKMEDWRLLDKIVFCVLSRHIGHAAGSHAIATTAQIVYTHAELLQPVSRCLTIPGGHHC